ncbi:MAG: aminotransferase class V-fold PLP-dependent enzyme [Sphingobacteriaceae bacterium]|nr:aminotransferase class V-fold PLP-dependent enzyme [Sphingobacteriaceae bacterium]
MKLETIAIHAGNHIDPSNRAVVQPLTLSTTFERGEDGEYPGGFNYTRAGNPNRRSLENVLARLESGVDACAFSSGNAAGSAVLQSLKPGSHIIAPDDMYHGLRYLINTVFNGILTVDYLDLSDLDAVASAIKPNTRLIWIETPSNPLLKITDISAICKIAHEKGILVCCDNTFATPVFQQPLDLGADIVMHATTKYLGGHSDVLGGTLITKDNNEFWERIRNVQVLSGAVPSPFDCYMAVRGIKTLPYRMRGHAANAKKIASYLQSHPRVEQVFYPGLSEHPLHEVAKTQMSDFGGMLSFTFKGSSDETREVSNNLKLFIRATSLGGVESLIEHRASVEGPDTKTPKNLLRVSVGLEYIDDLIADLEQALK